MARSLEEFNQDYRFNQFIAMEEAARNPQQTTKSTVVSNILFYSAIVLIIFFAFLYSQQAKQGGNLFGYSYYNILTTSMQSVLPQGSFILVKQTEGKDLEVGDDITFAENDTKLITHRIIQIYEDYEDSGQRGFQTKGVDNPAPDVNIVYEGNIVGKVIWNAPYLGFAFEFVGNNIFIFAGGIALLLLLAFFLRMFFTPDDRGTTVNLAGEA